MPGGETVDGDRGLSNFQSSTPAPFMQLRPANPRPRSFEAANFNLVDAAEQGVEQALQGAVPPNTGLPPSYPIPTSNTGYVRIAVYNKDIWWFDTYPAGARPYSRLTQNQTRLDSGNEPFGAVLSR